MAERRTEAEPVDIARFQRTGDVIADALKLRRSDQTMVAGDPLLGRPAPAAVAAQRIGGGPQMDLCVCELMKLQVDCKREQARFKLMLQVRRCPAPLHFAYRAVIGAVFVFRLLVLM